MGGEERSAFYRVAVIEFNVRLPRANDFSDIVEGSYLLLLDYRNGTLCTRPGRQSNKFLFSRRLTR